MQQGICTSKMAACSSALYTASLWTSFAMLVCSASSPWLTNMYSVHIATPTQHSVGNLHMQCLPLMQTEC